MALRDIKHRGTEKGQILKTIVWYGAETFDQIDSIYSQSSIEYRDPHILLGELIQEGDVTHQKGKYIVRPALRADYEFYEENQNEYYAFDMEEWAEIMDRDDAPEPEQWYPDLIGSVKSWIRVQKPEIYSKKNHFYLAGHYLDGFIKHIIEKADKEIIVVNPFVDRSYPAQLLVRSRRNGKTVVLVTRPPNSSYNSKNLQWLMDQKISILYHKDVHAKIILVDELVAVVSSMNFIKNATAGTTWEAGIVTLDKATVDSIKASITDLNLKHIH